MSLIECFKRDNTKIILNIDSDLGTCAPIYPFSFNYACQESAELAKRRFNKQLREFKKDIARTALSYLEPWEITDMKRKLKDWNSITEMWKWME